MHSSLRFERTGPAGSSWGRLLVAARAWRERVPSVEGNTSRTPWSATIAPKCFPRRAAMTTRCAQVPSCSLWRPIFLSSHELWDWSRFSQVCPSDWAPPRHEIFPIWWAITQFVGDRVANLITYPSIWTLFDLDWQLTSSDFWSYVTVVRSFPRHTWITCRPASVAHMLYTSWPAVGAIRPHSMVIRAR